MTSKQPVEYYGDRLPSEAAKKSEKQIPRGLQPAGEDKYKWLRHWPERQLYPNNPVLMTFSAACFVGCEAHLLKR